MESKTDNRENFNMNISNYLNFFFTDKWSVNGALGCIMAFYSQLLVNLSGVSASIGICTALVGLAVAVLSFYKLYIQVQKERFEFEQLRNEKVFNEIDTVKDIKL